MTPNFPETDIQFIARMLLRVREGQQIAMTDEARLREIAQTGTSDSMPPPTDEEVARARASGATVLGQ